MPSGAVLHGCRDGVHVLRFVGDVRYPIAPSVTEFLSQLFAADDELTGFVVDLTETTAIDSTNLGVLARLGVQVKERCGRRATIVSGDQDIRELLVSMGISCVCEIVDRAPDATDATAAVADARAVAQDELARVMLDAHRALMDLSRSNRDQFHDVVAMLERATKER